MATAQKQNTELLQRVRYAFERQGTTYSKFCDKNDIDRRNATRAILGTWSGKKANQLKSRILSAANTNGFQVDSVDATNGAKK